MAKKIIIHKQAPVETPNTKVLHDTHASTFFMRFVESQKQSKTKKRGLTEQGCIELHAKTVDILNHCNPNNATNNDEVTHLVVGYVQSGKTMSFTALTALAKDNGYRVIIYLAGTKQNLVNQTAKRLEKDLIKNTPENHGAFRIHRSPTLNNASEIEGHLKLSDKPIILIPILKHQKHIENVKNIFQFSNIVHLMENETVLIIDDEADQASLNGFGRYNSKHEDELDKASKIYSEILNLRAVLPGNSYIQYTATPQANILIGMQDILSPRSHTLLNPGEGYVGGKLFFGMDENQELYQGRLIRTIPDDEILIRKKQEPQKLPKSLRDALRLHVLATAIVVKYLKIEDVYFLSMMVHVDQTKQWSKKYKKWIDNELNSWSVLLDKPDGHEDKNDLYEAFESLFPMAVEFYDKEQITFDKIKPLIKDVINDRKVYLVNTDKDAETEVDWERYTMHILVGAQMLDRGFTVENLATTYMPRCSQNTTNSDTIQQRCRFFGYKMPYIKSCRVFLPKVSVEYYMDYVHMEEELRSVLAECDSLIAAERKLLLSNEKLRPTRQNVLPVSIVNNKLTGCCATNAFNDPKLIRHNDEVVDGVLSKYSSKLSVLFDGGKDSYTHRGFKMTIDEAIEFLTNFQYKNYRDVMRKAATIRYLRYLCSMNVIKYVYFIQMAYKQPPRERPVDHITHEITSNLFQGRSVNYKGDTAYVGEDSITIQLYNICFKNSQPIGFPKRAYTLAFNYPEELKAIYVSAEKEKQFNDEINEED